MELKVQNPNGLNQISGSLSSSKHQIVSKSPYMLQYKNFEDRLNSKKIKPKYASLLLRVKCKKIQDQKDENYLQLTKKFIENKEKIIFFQNKENYTQPTIAKQKQDELLASIKAKINVIRNPSQISKTTFDRSHQFDDKSVRDCITQISSIRSRVKSQANTIVSRKGGKVDDSRAITFLNYKKDKKSFASKLVF